MRYAGEGLVGRDAELAAIDALLQGARSGTSGVVTLVGEPGSGKTSLLEAARARASDFLVASCCGVEWEAELPFSALHELLAPYTATLAGLPIPQRDALEGALGLRELDAPRLLNVHAGALSALSELSRREPVLVLVDDLQWIDSSTRNALAFVARRCEHEPIVVIAATRPEAARALGVGTVHDVDALGPDAARLLLEQLVGRVAPDDAIRDLLAATGGNPLAIVQAVAHLGERALQRGSTLDEPLPLGDLLDRGFADDVAELSDAARSAAELVAASLSRDAALLWLAARGAGLPDTALQEALDAGLLVQQRGRFDFAHPVLRSLVHRMAPPERWRSWHAALAQVTTSLELQTWHRATATLQPDDAVADALDEAAAAFTRRGGAVATAQALARASELTLDPDLGARRLVRAGRAAMFAQRPEWAVELVSGGRDRAASRRTRLYAEHELLILDMLFGGREDGHGPFRELAAAALAEGDHELAFDSVAHAVNDAAVRGQGAAAREMLGWLDAQFPPEVLREYADAVKALHVEYEVLHSGRVRVDGPMAQDMIALARAATASLGGDGEGVPISEAADQFWLIEPLTQIEAREEAHALLDAHVRASIDQAAPHALQLALATRAQMLIRTGDWASASGALVEASRVGQMGGGRATASVVTATQAYLDGCQRAADVRAQSDDARATGRAAAFDVIEEYAGAAEGAALLTAGDARSAVQVLERVRAWKRAAGQGEPCTPTWWPDLIDAHLAAGDRALAAERLEELRAFAVAADRRWALASVAWFDGVLAAEDAFARCFADALARWADLQAPFERARTRLAFAARLSDAGRRADAIDQLELALDELRRLGADPWAARARRALGEPERRRATAASRDRDALTPQERQVAQLVAGGASNKEAAGELFLSPKTVEAHLSRIYRKLGVTSRTQLAARWPELEL